MWELSDWANEVDKLEARVVKLNGWLSEHESALAKSRHETNVCTAEVEALRTALGDALDAIDFARSEGFEWPTDPYTPAILKACPPIKLPGAKEEDHD